MLSNEWLVAGALIALLVIGLIVPRRATSNSKGDKNRGKVS
jgi:hypothetical protein